MPTSVEKVNRYFAAEERSAAGLPLQPLEIGIGVVT
jgi:hypothetical protein